MTSLETGSTARHIDPEQIVAFLVGHGVLRFDPGRASVTKLTGGVSGVAYLVESGPQRVVVKRALGQLLVQAEWFAKPERAITEAAAIEVLHRLTPQQTPELLDVDTELCTFVMSAAPSSWVPWKTRLMADDIDVETETAVASTLGWVLATWHRETAADVGLADRFADYEAFEQLRLDPFHRAVARIHPDLSQAIRVCIHDLITRRDCLVHGDFSPKNVLVGTDGLMALDFEVAHVGASVFDVAFMNCHLLLKAAHHPSHAPLLRQISAIFTGSYSQVRGAVPAPNLGWHTACLLLARVDGVSPAGYLDLRGQILVREIARAALSRDSCDLDTLWDEAEMAAQ